MDDHGFVVCAFNRTVSKVDHFLAHEAKGTKIVGASSIEDLCKKLKRPRKVMLMVKAGDAVDGFIKQLLPYLEPGDIIIDGGNSHFPDTERRMHDLEGKGLLYVGCGVSGGEEGARYGPSLMPGGSGGAWEHIKDIFQGIAAKTDGQPCCEWVGGGGSGHYVKMVHNGIEYGDMQLICEAYQLMLQGAKMSHDAIAQAFEEWNGGELESFLIEITRDILRYKTESGEVLVEKILDTAGQKGTGKWTAFSALDMGMPVTLIAEAVFARCLSALKKERVKASRLLAGPDAPEIPADYSDKLGKALYAAKILSYTQGFMLLREAAKENGWTLDYGAIALMWRGGCIIRSRFLGDIRNAYKKDPLLPSLLFAPFFQEALSVCHNHLRVVVADAVMRGVPIPAFSSALSFYDGYRSERLPANLLQAQRDYFGAHTYELLEKEGVFVHTNWTGRGGEVASSTYNA